MSNNNPLTMPSAAFEGLSAKSKLSDLILRKGYPSPNSRTATAKSTQTIYDPWNPAVGNELVGRTDVLEELQSAFDTCRSINLVGDRRIGKTSLLMTWAKQAKASGRVVRWFSGKDPETRTMASFVQAVTGQVASDQPDEAANQLEDWVGSVGQPGLPPLVIVDDSDGLFPCVHYRFWQRIRGMLDFVPFVFGTQLELDLIYQQNRLTSPLANRLQWVPLGLLTHNEANQLIARGNSYWQKGDVELLRHWCGNHPFFLQLFGCHLAQARIEGRSLQTALDDFADDAKKHLCDLANSWSKRERIALKQALEGQNKNGRSLRNRGLLTSENHAFGHVLVAFLRDEL